MAASPDDIRTWKEAALRPTATHPVMPHQLDQILAAARDAGLSEREQGVLVLVMSIGDVAKRPGIDKLPPSKQLALAASIAMRMLQSQTSVSSGPGS